MKRVNLVLLLGLLAGLVVCGGGVFALHRFQVSRNAGGLVKLARQKLEQGNTGEAMRLFSRYLGMRPDDVAVHREYAELVLEQTEGVAASQADLQRAYNSLEEAVRRNPEDDDLRLKLAEFQVRVGRFSDAREHLQTLESRRAGRPAEPDGDAPQLDPTKMQMLLARSLAGDGDYDAAARLTGDLIGYDVQQRTFDPDRKAIDETEPYVLLARILEQQLDDPAAASQILDELGRRRPDDAEAWLEIGRWHRQRGDLQAASEDFERARAIAPDAPNVVWAAFELALAKGDVAEAENIAKRARELFPGDERVYRGLAALALQRSDLPAAEAVLRDGVMQLPGKGSLLLMLADTLLQQGKLDDTEAVVTQIEELFGTANPAVGLLESRVLIARRRWPQAKRRLDEIRPLSAGVPELIRQIDLCLAQCAKNLDENDIRLDVSRRILVDDPTSLAARVDQADALSAAGRFEDALAEFEAVAEAIPAERLPTVPQVWYPLLQLRTMAQLKLPVGERDWSGVDALVRQLEESTAVSESQIALLRADILARKGEGDAAADILERASRAENAEPQVWAALALLRLREGGVEAAREVLARIPAERLDHPALVAVRMQLAARAPAEEMAREFTDLEAAADKATPEDGSRLLSSLAGLRMELGDAAEAERLWRKAADLEPDDLRARTALLELAMKSGDVEKAKAAAAAIEEVAGEKSGRALVAQAGVRILEVRQAQERKELETGKVELSDTDKRLLDEARNLLIEAENERPGWQLVQVYSAEIDGLRGDIPAAIERLQRAVKIGPATPETVRQLVALLYASNRLEEARQALDMLGPDGLAGFERLSAEMELRAGRLDEAVAIAERSVSLDSKNGGELLWLGQLLERSGRREQAGELFERAVEATPDRAEIWIALFAHQLSTGKRRAAEATLSRAMEALESPGRDLVRAQGSEMLGRIDDADQAFRDAVAAAPEDVGIATARSEFLIRAGRLDAAREFLRQIVASKQDDAATRAMRSWARRKLAELTADRGTYAQLREALALIDENIAVEGRLLPDDAAVKVTLLANRPEPESWRQAVGVLETLREQQPLTTAQRLTLSALLDKVGRWEEARQELMAIVAAPRTPPAFVAMLADKLIDHGEVANARAWVKRLQDTAPTAPVTLALEARLAIAEKDRVRAADLARRLMPPDDVPNDQAAQLAAIAKLLEDLGFAKPADKVLGQYAERSPDGVVARAQFLGRQGRPAEALDAIEASWSALSLERVLTVAIDILRSSPQDAAAAERVGRWIAKARREDPESVVIALVDAELRSLQDRPAEVESLYRTVLARKDLTPLQVAIVSNNLAFHLAQPKTAVEAKKLIDGAIDAIGPHPDLLDTRGLVRLALGENSEAVADLEEAVLQPSDVKYLHLAYAKLRTGDKSAAREALESGRTKGLTVDRLSAADRARLRELESALGVAPEQADADEAAASRG